MRVQDSLHSLARYYDQLMDHVDYERWEWVTTCLSDLLPQPFRHIDLACGTGTLLKTLRRRGWDSMGLDLSRSMMRNGWKTGTRFPAVTADLCALPFSGTADYLTCLFDSMNFLLEPEQICQAIDDAYAALKPGGLYYFDVVTEKMVLTHFAGQSWTEQKGRLTTKWASEYDRDTKLAETTVTVNGHTEAVIYERVYSRDLLEAAITDAGFQLLGVYDAETWRRPGRRTIRLDLVAVKPPFPLQADKFSTLARQIKDGLK